jgi:plastocyanin
VVAALVLGALLGGCDGREAEAGRPPATTEPDGDVVIALHERALVPGEVEVPAGATVRWENLDPVEHELVSLSGDVIRSPVLGQAASYEVQLGAPGEHPYYCKIHNYMKGTVVVR